MNYLNTIRKHLMEIETDFIRNVAKEVGCNTKDVLISTYKRTNHRNGTIELMQQVSVLGQVYNINGHEVINER